MNFELIGIIIYVLGMISLGIYFSQRIKTEDDYYLGGRTLGPILSTFAIFATWFGAETCIGTSGAVYRHGLSAIHTDPLGYSLCLLLMGLFLAKVLWSKKITTVPDLFRKRYSPATEKFAAFIMIPSSIIWAAAQVRALGQIFHATTDFGPMTAVTIAASVVIIYTMAGGMLADAYADLIQGLAIIAGLIFLVISLIMDMGGWQQAIQVIPPTKLVFSGGEFSGLGLLGKIELWLVPILGSLVAQELVGRVCASRSAKMASQSALRAAFLYLAVGFIPVIIGLLGVHEISSLADSETLLPMLAKKHLHYFFYVAFIGALISAILSTVDTTLLSASALLAHNLIFRSNSSNFSQKKRVLIARLCTLAAGLVSYVIASFSESITQLVELASSLGGPTILVLTLMALWEKKGTAFHALFAMSVSVITWILAHFYLKVDFPIILTISMCTLGYFASLVLMKQRSKLSDLGDQTMSEEVFKSS